MSISVFAVTLVFIYGIRRFWPFGLGADKADGVRKIQSTPILRVGGLALAAAFTACFYAYTFAPETPNANSVGVSFALLGLSLFLVGFIDDLFSLSALLKFVAQAVVGVGAYLADMRIEVISSPFGDGSIHLGNFAIIVTVIWFVAIPNLINLIDGMDGLAGGVGLFLSLTLGGIGLLSGNPFLATMGMGFAGGLAAFLIFNFPPAKIYMGDGGAYLIGYFIAATSLITSNKGSVTGPLLVVALGLGFPILDTALTVTRRALSGMPIMGADAQHLHHRLLTLGFSKRTILLILYGIFATLGLLGLAVYLIQGYALPVVAAIVIFGAFIGLKIIGLPHNFAEAKLLFQDMIATRKDVRYAYALAQVLQHDLERVPSADAFWGKLLIALGKLNITPATENLGKRECSPDQSHIVLFPVSENLVWHLGCRKSNLRHNQWDRIIRCFHLIVITGIEKWGAPPKKLGLREVNHDEHPQDSVTKICRQTI
ncbi:MAG: undecaprenyl/decaprenyl-phosphate alpha-N-acetylglucosaminyl 1-phosphate transferase [Verrucomicrobia bacterium]|nr:undecaprenyl/decaprenyl-phosphate alpha-N-acetylglucosaminyl 1-phosphate transferase [Verrucomicrobiota bacterium]